MIVPRLYKDDRMAVLVSPGFGAGWSTWICPEAAYDKRIIEYWIENGNDIDEDIFTNLLKDWGYNESSIYLGGWYNIILKWVKIGEFFYIEEYDGSEMLVNQDMMGRA